MMSVSRILVKLVVRQTSGGAAIAFYDYGHDE